MPKVSVIIPVYNVESYLRECLDSVVNQSLEDIEIICVNDGSTDSSLEILREYKAKDKRIVIVNQYNQGQSSARNRGSLLAIGEYILFLDSDDLLEVGALEYLWNEAIANQLDVLYFDARSIYETVQLEKEKKSYQTYYERKNKYKNVVNGKQLFVMLIKDFAYRVSPCLQLIRHDFLEQTGIFFKEGIIYEDNIFTTELILTAKRVSHRGEKLYIRRIRNCSTMMRQEDFFNLYSYLVCVIELTKFGQRCSFDVETSAALNKFIQSRENDIIRIFNKLSDNEKGNFFTLSAIEQMVLTQIIQMKGTLKMDEIIFDERPVEISVIIPVYKVEKYIEKCLDSVSKQSFDDIEIICIDDGSPDKSAAICVEYAKKDKRIKVIHQENMGLSAARNTGIINASGKYLAFIDSDDWVHPNFLETLYRLCEDNDCFIAECGLQKLHSEEETIAEYHCDAEIISGIDAIHRRFEIDGWRHGVIWNKLYRKELFDNVRFPIGRQHEDEYTTYKLLWKTERYAYSESKLYYYRQRSDSIMGKKFSEKSLDKIPAYEERVSFFQNKDEKLYYKSLIVLNSSLYHSIIQFRKLYPKQESKIKELEDKLKELQMVMDKFGIDYKETPPEYPVFPREVCVKITESCHYKLKNQYGIPGVFTRESKISVIIPVYNAEKYLEECLTSVLNQTLIDIEIITVNDGSTDQSLNILNRYANGDNRIIVINQPNLGVFTARNRAMRVACGEFVCFMDADDFYPDRDTLELLYTKAKQSNTFICGGSFSNYKDGSLITEFEGDNVKYRFLSEGIVQYKDYQFDYGYHRFIYNRQFLLENNIFFPHYRRFQDPPFFVKAMVTAGEFYAVPNVVYCYRVGFQVRPASWPVEKLRDMLKGYRDNLDLSREFGLEELHALTVRRIEDSYTFSPIMETLLTYDYETLSLLISLNNSIDPVLLKKSGMDLQGKDFYVLREIKNLIWRCHNAENISNTALENASSQKLSYREPIKNMINRILRKIRGGIRCYKEHGFKYTVKRTFEHLKTLMEGK